MRTVYIVCSGPSLKGFDFSLLDGKDVICVNKTIKWVDNPVAVVALDSKHYVQLYDEFAKLECPIYAMKRYDEHPIKDELGVIELENTGVNGIEYDEGIRHGFNSGYMAMNVAIKLGYDNLRVLGMDLNKGGHFYDNEAYDYRYVLAHLKAFKDELMDNIQVTFYGNTNADMFENKPLDEISSFKS